MSIFDKLGDKIMERIMPGAFDRALEEDNDVLGLFNHDQNQLLGRRSIGTRSWITSSTAPRLAWILV